MIDNHLCMLPVSTCMYMYVCTEVPVRYRHDYLGTGTVPAVVPTPNCLPVVYDTRYRFEGADDWEKTRYNLGFYHESNNLCLYSCKCLQHEKKKRIDLYRRINHLVIFLVHLM